MKKKKGLTFYSLVPPPMELRLANDIGFGTPGMTFLPSTYSFESDGTEKAKQPPETGLVGMLALGELASFPVGGTGNTLLWVLSTSSPLQGFQGSAPLPPRSRNGI